MKPRLFELPKSLESKGNEEYEKLIEVFENIAARFEEVFYDNTTTEEAGVYKSVMASAAIILACRREGERVKLGTTRVRGAQRVMITLAKSHVSWLRS